MRRLWAYIILSITALIVVGTAFTPVFVNVNANAEYSEGREVVFRISDKDNDDGDATPEIANGTAIDEIVDVMKERMGNTNVSRYEIAKEGNDTVKVTFSAETQDEYEKIKTYLSFNGSLALTTTDEVVAVGEDFLLEDKKSYVDDINGYPTVVVPVDVDNPQYKAVIEAAEDLLEKENNKPQEDSEQADPQVFIYMWYDYVKDVDTYDKTLETLEDGSENPEYDPNIAAKIFLRFNVAELYFPDNNDNKLATSINVDTNSDGAASVAEIKAAYSNAKYYVNLLNAGELNYKVTYLYENSVPAFSESLISYSQNEHLAWSRTLIATLSALAIVALLLFVFYRLGALSIVVNTVISVFAAVSFIVIFSAEFNVAGVIGLILTAVASLASGVIYCNKLKEEAYRGRSLKKANQEAAKKSLFPIIDINVAIIAVGAFAYLFGGVFMKSFAAATVLGGIISLLANLILHRILMWLATNTTGFTGKYEVFGINKANVPNILNEEKQTYFGAFEKQDFTKKRKPIGIVSSVLLVASIAGMITFGIIGKGNVFNTQEKVVENSEIYFETTNKYSEITLSYIETTLGENVYIEQANAEAKPLSDYIASVDEYSRDEVDEYGATTTYHYFVVTLNAPLKTTVNASYKVGTTTIVASMPINDMFQELNATESIDDKLTVELKEVTTVVSGQLNFIDTLIPTVIAIAVVGLYYILRHKLSRGLAAMGLAYAATGITYGLLILTRIPLPTYVNIAVPFVAALSLIFAAIFMNREKEYIQDARIHNISIEERNELSKKANSIAFGPMLIIAIIALYILVLFYGFGPLDSSAIFLAAIVGSLIALLLVTTLISPLAGLIFKRTSKIHVDIKPRKGKKRHNKIGKSNSAEPEEAVFIGIND